MDRTQIGTGTPWEGTVGYSRGVRVGPHVWISGTTAIGDDGQLVGRGDAYAQARQILRIIERALERLGATMADVVRTRMYVTRVADWEAVGRAHGECFADVRPASTLVEVSALVDPDMLVEIDVDAFVAGD